MLPLGTITAVGLVVLAGLIWLFIRTRTKDMIEEFMKKRRASSKLVTRADYVEGPAHFTVATAVSDTTFFYENADIQASLELAQIDEIEYDDELATGKAVHHGKVLRLRSHGHTFEFIVEPGDVAKWQATMPPRRFDAPAARTA